MRLVSCRFTLLLLACCTFPLSAQPAPDGDALYRKHCAGCHEGSLPLMPGREALRAYDPRAIVAAMTSFSMVRQAAALSPAERRAVAEFLTGTPAGSYGPALAEIPASAYCAANAKTTQATLAGAAWNGWGAGLANTRFQTAAAAGLTAAEVPRLKLKWAFGVPGVASSGSQATIAAGRVFLGSMSGLFFALNAQSGCIEWVFDAGVGIRSTPTVAEIGPNKTLTVFFGDTNAQVFAVDAVSGKPVWKVKLDQHPNAMITGGTVYHDGRLYVPVASLEEAAAVIATYPCCSFRGSLVALDAVNGKTVWQTFTLRQSTKPTIKSRAGVQNYGPSGAAIWSAPTLDPARNRIYVGVGDNYSSPAVDTSDSIMALELSTGHIIWVSQALKGDAWNVSCSIPDAAGRTNCPEGAGPDHDFGSSPALVSMANGKSMVLGGQKSGVLHAFNPDTGALLWSTRIGEGGVIGGIEWGFAVDGTAAYVSLSNAMEKPAGEAGGLTAVRLSDGGIVWAVPPVQGTCTNRPGCNSGQPAAVSGMPGVIFSGSVDGHLRAYDVSSGKVIWDFDTARKFDTVNGVAAKGGALNGPGATIVNGMVYVNSGYASFGFMPGNVLLAFAVGL